MQHSWWPPCGTGVMGHIQGPLRLPGAWAKEVAFLALGAGDKPRGSGSVSVHQDLGRPRTSSVVHSSTDRALCVP